MEYQNYKLVLKMGWEFIVKADNKKEGLEKLDKHLDNLSKQDGFSTMSFSAKENIKSNNYSMEIYVGTVIC